MEASEDVVAGFSPRSTPWKQTRAKARDYILRRSSYGRAVFVESTKYARLSIKAARCRACASRIASTVMAIAITALVCLLGSATANAQLAEDVFKNVQVLKGIPVDQFMDTMGFFR